MKLRLFTFIAFFGAISLTEVSAEGMKPLEERPQDAAAWLNWMAKSAVDKTFSGIYIHRYGSRMETSRVSHLANMDGEQEKLETLDGPPLEIIRKNDEVTCYIPDAKLMRVDRKRARKFFPGLLTDISSIAENYSPKLGGIERVAGHDCQVVILNSKDNFRYGHTFCAELNSGLMLRATLISDKADILEQFAFTQIAIGNPINSDFLKSSYTDKKNGWQTDKSGLQNSLNSDSSWYVKSLPAGFKKVAEIKRAMSGQTEPVIQQIYSDGLASVSVFIEVAQTGGNLHPSLLQQGNYSLYVRPLVDQHFSIKVLGEVPFLSLQRIGNSLASQPH